MSKHHGWMNIGSEPDADPDSDNCCLELEEILHYACPANGDIHPVVPGKILCFPTPAMLPPGVQWADIPFADAIPAPAARHFSADFLADLLADLGVAVAVCLSPADYDRAAFLARGIAVEDLDLDPAAPHMLRALDRFRALADAAPGPIALHSGDAVGPGHLCALVLSHLVGRAGFDPPAAVAWALVAHPRLLTDHPLESPGPRGAAVLAVPSGLIRTHSFPPPEAAAGGGDEAPAGPAASAPPPPISAPAVRALQLRRTASAPAPAQGVSLAAGAARADVSGYR